MSELETSTKKWGKKKKEESPSPAFGLKGKIAALTQEMEDTKKDLENSALEDAERNLVRMQLIQQSRLLRILELRQACH